MTHVNPTLLREIRGDQRFADYFAEVLARAGVRHVFAMPAESLNPLIDAIRLQPSLQLITVRHEGAGALMASATAKLTGRLGVCMGTEGPGATHLPIGSQDAFGDAAPLLSVCGQVPTAFLGSGAFQEVDAASFMGPSSVLARSIISSAQAALLPQLCTEALFRSAPVNVSLPADVARAPLDYEEQPKLDFSWRTSTARVDRAQIRSIAARLGEAQNVVLLIGSGAPQKGDLIGRVAAALDAEILCSPEAWGSPAAEHARPIGLRASSPSRRSLANAGAVLVIGKIDGALPAMFGPAPVLQIGPLGELGRPPGALFTRACGEQEELLETLLEVLGSKPAADRVAIEPSEVWAKIDRAIEQDAILSVEPGPLLDLVLENLPARRRRLTTSFSRQVRGYALPGAMAARIAYPERHVLCLCTASGFSELLGDLMTAAKYQLRFQVLCAGENGAIDLARFAASCGFDRGEIRDWTEVPESIRGARAKAAFFQGQNLLPPSEPIKTAAPEASFAGALAGALHAAGVTRIYGRVRPSIEPLIAALRGIDPQIFVPAAHQESAAMMASAAAKRSGSVTACIAADELDLPYFLNGLYDAAFDAAPVLVLAPLGSGAILREVASHRCTYQNDRALSRIVAESVAHTRWSNAVTFAAVDFSELLAAAASDPFPIPALEHVAAAPIPSSLSLDDAQRRISAAQRPLLLAGRGAKDARQAVERLARKLSAPIVATMAGRGVVSDLHPHFIGGIGSSGHRAALRALKQTDLLVVLGVSSRGALTGPKETPSAIQIDLHPGHLGRRAGGVLGLYGDVRATIEELCDRLERVSGPSAHQPARERFFSERQADFASEVRRSSGWFDDDRGPIKPSSIAPAVCAVLDELGERAVITGDVGLNTLWLYRYFLGDHHLIWSGSFGTMGFALPAAIAIAQREPKKPVVAMMGDGGFAITMAELKGAVELGVPIVVVVFDNGKLGAIKFEQEVMGWPEFGSELYNCNFAEFAEAAGAVGLRVEHNKDLRPALRRAFSAKKPVIVDVVCDPHELPSPPEIRPGQAAGFLVARVREARGTLSRAVRKVRT